MAIANYQEEYEVHGKPLTKIELATLIGNRLKKGGMNPGDFHKIAHEYIILMFPEVLRESKPAIAGRPKGSKNKVQKEKPVNVDDLVRKLEAQQNQQKEK
jgi:hypothetical protein